MKKVTTILAAILLMAVGVTAQKLSYSSVVRNSDNELIANTNLTVEISIANSNGGAAVYSETHSVTTNQNGLVTLLIGDGTGVTGSMSDVTWQTAYITSKYTLPDGALVQNTAPVTAVPYALYAEKTGSSATGSANMSDGNVNVSMPISDFVNSLTEDEKLALCAALGCSSGGGGGDTPGGEEPTTFFCGISTVEDVDHNIYHTVKIGNQCWLKENMRATHYSPNVSYYYNLTETTTATCQLAVESPDWIVYYSAPGSHNSATSDPSLTATYGLLYDWYAATGGNAVGGTQGICPDGWHIPSTAEFQTMLTAAELSTTDNQHYSPANKLSTGTWNGSSIAGAPGNTAATSNASHFSALPAGAWTTSLTSDVGIYGNLNRGAYFWTSTISYHDGVPLPDCLELTFDSQNVEINSEIVGGMSVRCVKD